MSQNQTDSNVTITLANQIGYERIAMACSASFAEMFDFPKDRIEDLKTVVAEAAINAMQHGNKGREHAKVVVSLSCQTDTITVRIADEGNGLKGKPPRPDIDKIIDEEQAICGFGLFLIEQLADRVAFKEAAGKGHVVEMALKMKA
ncbi:MAG: ATP-binding protein [Deltaproteobacteria bacterium]|jgi:serine/threonine-protein kinase RsbW